MQKHKYGMFEDNQFEQAKKNIRKQIYFLLLIVDVNTKEDYPNVKVEEAYTNVFNYLNGLNELLLYPPELVRIISLLTTALNEYRKSDFSFDIYRKLVLDAGCEVLNIKGVS